MELKEGPRACPGLSGWEKVKEGRIRGALMAGGQGWAGPLAISGESGRRDMDGTIVLGRTKTLLSVPTPPRPPHTLLGSA